MHYARINEIKRFYEEFLKYKYDIKMSSVEITEGEIEHIENVCHSLLGSMLQMGWQLGKKTDTAGINLGLHYSGLTGVVAQKERFYENKVSSEEVFMRITSGDSRQIDGNIEYLLSYSEGLYDKVREYFDAIEPKISKRLPKYINSPTEELECLEACIAMYFVGESITIE